LPFYSLLQGQLESVNKIGVLSQFHLGNTGEIPPSLPTPSSWGLPQVACKNQNIFFWIIQFQEMLHGAVLRCVTRISQDRLALFDLVPNPVQSKHSHLSIQ
jgi:hypothetical protein